jgi:hypothetical protein
MSSALLSFPVDVFRTGNSRTDFRPRPLAARARHIDRSATAGGRCPSSAWSRRGGRRFPTGLPQMGHPLLMWTDTSRRSTGQSDWGSMTNLRPRRSATPASSSLQEGFGDSGRAARLPDDPLGSALTLALQGARQASRDVVAGFRRPAFRAEQPIENRRRAARHDHLQRAELADRADPDAWIVRREGVARGRGHGGTVMASTDQVEDHDAARGLSGATPARRR